MTSNAAGPVVDGGGREECYRCHKPALTCVCRTLPRVRNRTGIWIGQHPRERFHPIGTARIALLGLERVQIELLRGASDTPPASLPPRCGLLYPHRDARDLAALAPEERPDALVVLDGTWAQARSLRRDQRWLERLPHYALTPPQASRYRLRKEPAARCVSTIEAIAHALRILEPETPGVGELLGSFDAMIDQQIALIEQHREGRRRRAVPRSVAGIPRWALREPERIVIAAFELAPRSGPSGAALAIVHCAALRIGTGELFQHFVEPPAGRFPAPHFLRHLGLDAEPLRAGSTQADLRAAWHLFVSAEDIVVAWNASVLGALDAAVGLPPRRIELKSIYRCRAKQARGPLSAMLAELGIEPRLPPPLCGRAGRHVAGMAALFAYLRAEGERR